MLTTVTTLLTQRDKQNNVVKFHHPSYTHFTLRSTKPTLSTRTQRSEEAEENERNLPKTRKSPCSAAQDEREQSQDLL